MGGYSSVARYFDCEYQGFRQDVDFYIGLLLEERIKGAVLEAGCGTGRVAAPIAAAGFRVSGFDHSEDMLRRARRRRTTLSADARLRLRFSRQDLTNFSYRHRFQVVILAFSTLNLLVDEANRRTCLDLIARHLEPGGLLLADLFNPGPQASSGRQDARRAETGFSVPNRSRLVSKTVEERDDPAAATTAVRYRYRERRRCDAALIASLDVEFSLARLQRRQVETALYAAGFDVETVYGDYARRPMTDRSPRMIFQARRLSDS